MIKIIKEGQESFVMTCPICGCQFAYELRDINMLSDSVYCPCCGRSIIHKNQAGDEHRDGAKYNDYPIIKTIYYPNSRTHYATDTSEE